MRINSTKFIRLSFLASIIFSHTILSTAHAWSWSGWHWPYNIDAKNSWFIGAGGGAANQNLPGSMSVINGAQVAPPMNQDRYSLNDPTAALFQFNVGYRWSQNCKYFPSWNLALQYRHYVKSYINGTVDQYSLPGFVNYNYQLSYEANLFTLNGKVDLIEYKKFLPYVAGGVGSITNHLNDYNETPTAGVTPRISPGYNGNSLTSLAFTLGVGIDYIVTDNVWLTLGYDHVFPTNLSTNAGNGSWSKSSLNVGNVNMDTIFLNVTANFPQTFTFRG